MLTYCKSRNVPYPIVTISLLFKNSSSIDTSPWRESFVNDPIRLLFNFRVFKTFKSLNTGVSLLSGFKVSKELFEKSRYISFCRPENMEYRTFVILLEWMSRYHNLSRPWNAVGPRSFIWLLLSWYRCNCFRWGNQIVDISVIMLWWRYISPSWRRFVKRLLSIVTILLWHKSRYLISSASLRLSACINVIWLCERSRYSSFFRAVKVLLIIWDNWLFDNKRRWRFALVPKVLLFISDIAFRLKSNSFRAVSPENASAAMELILLSSRRTFSNFVKPLNVSFVIELIPLLPASKTFKSLSFCNVPAAISFRLFS